jgi:hypothetical protein
MYINCTINGIKGHTLLAVLIFFLFLISCDKKKKEAITIKNEIPSSSSVQEENQLQSDLQIDENLEYEEFIYTSTFNNAPTAIRTTATNLGTKPRKATFQYWLDGGFSQTVSITKEIPPRTRMVIEPSAELKLTRNAFAIKNETQTVLQTRVYGLEDGKKLPLFERSYKVKLFPPQFFNWQTPELIAAFVTYQMDSMPALQREISRKVGSIMSYQAGPEKAEEQVKAVYDIIAERRWHYLTGFSISTGGQKVRYPIETLREKSANCIEGTLLFSAIIESLNIETAIVLVNRPEGRHAYLAWKSDPKGDFDKFIETTAAFAASDVVNYEKAASVGAQGAYDDDKGRYIEKVIPVRKMWNSGVSVNEVP